MLPLTINGKSYMASPMTPWYLTFSDLEGQRHGHLDFMWWEICMVYIYLPAIYYHFNLDTKDSFFMDGVFRCPSGLSCFYLVGSIYSYCMGIGMSLGNGELHVRLPFDGLRVRTHSLGLPERSLGQLRELQLVCGIKAP